MFDDRFVDNTWACEALMSLPQPAHILIWCALPGCYCYCCCCAGAASNHGIAEQPQLTQQIVDSSISRDSDSGSTDAPTSKPAASVLKQLVLATPKQSSYSLYGSHAVDATEFTAQQLQEWPVQDCKDYVVGDVCLWIKPALSCSSRYAATQ
jgi:hypothetical protein